MKNILSNIVGAFKPMYAVKPSSETMDNGQPYKLYKVNIFGIPQPKKSRFDHKYSIEQTALTLLECFRNGHKVYVLQEKIIPGEQPGEAPQNQEEIARHLQWKQNLINALQSQSPQDVSHEIAADPIRLYGTRSSTTKKESYNEIAQHHRKS